MTLGIRCPFSLGAKDIGKIAGCQILSICMIDLEDITAPYLYNLGRGTHAMTPQTGPANQGGIWTCSGIYTKTGN